MDTAAASERGWGMDPVTAARAPPAGRPERRSDWTVATLADDPPPNTRACRPDTPAAASWSGALRVPTWRTAPGTPAVTAARLRRRDALAPALRPARRGGLAPGRLRAGRADLVRGSPRGRVPSRDPLARSGRR